MKICISCSSELQGLQTKFCSQSCKNKWFQITQKNKFKEETGFSFQSYKGLKRKLSIVEELGGCSKCGYNTNLSALEFHHLDPKTKLFNVDMRMFSNSNIELIKKELEKCILLCSNCHQEEHNPTLNIENVKKKL